AKAPKTRAHKASSHADGVESLRVRMYRVGFGDFFLVTVPSPTGDQHILIDCGVTSGRTGNGDIKTIKSAVRHMAEATNKRLALIIVTHRHQDHIIGFSRCADQFAEFQVDAVWMPVWETEYDDAVKNFQKDLTDLAWGVQQFVGARGTDDEQTGEMLGMLE